MTKYEKKRLMEIGESLNLNKDQFLSYWIQIDCLETEEAEKKETEQFIQDNCAWLDL